MKMENVRWIELVLLVLAASFMGFAIMINSAKITGNAISNNFIVNGGNGGEFNIKSLKYHFDSREIIIDYSLEELTGKDQEISVAYTLRNFDGDKVASGRQDIILSSGQDGNYRARLEMPENAKGAFRLSFSAWNGKESKWAVEEVGSSGMSISGMAVAENTDKTGNIVLMLLILTFIILLVVLYLRRHNARVEAFVMEKRKLIPFEI